MGEKWRKVTEAHLYNYVLWKAELAELERDITDLAKEELIPYSRSSFSHAPKAKRVRGSLTERDGINRAERDISHLPGGRELMRRQEDLTNKLWRIDFALARLPERQRQIIELAYFQEKTNAIDLLGISPSTYSTHRKKALETVARCLGLT